MVADNLTNPSDAFVESEEDAPDTETPETPDAPVEGGDTGASTPEEAPAPAEEEAEPATARAPEYDADAERADADALAKVKEIQSEHVGRLLEANEALRSRVEGLNEIIGTATTTARAQNAKIVALQKKLASAGVAL